MDKNRLFSILRILFIGLNGLIIIAGVVCFILGNIKFATKFYFSGSFIGGQLAAISLLFIVYGCVGLFGAIKRDKVLIMIYAGIAAVSLTTRMLFWALAAMHGYSLEAFNYAYVALELTIMLMSALLFYIIK